MLVAAARYKPGRPLVVTSVNGSNDTELPKFIAATISAPKKRDSSLARYGAI